MFPGAGYVSMLVAASGATQTVVLEDINFTSALILEKEKPKKLQSFLSSSNYVKLSLYCLLSPSFFFHVFFDSL